MGHEGPCAEGSDPRKAGVCFKCAKPIVSLPPIRDQIWEQQRLAEAVELSERVFGRRAPFFAREVAQRLAKGAEEYGERNHLNHDCYAEAMEEPGDVAAWLMLGMQADKSNLTAEDFMELERLAVEAFAHAAACYEVLRVVQHKRSEMIG